MHACTEEFPDGRENERVHDLVDLLLARGILIEGDLPPVREACVAIFNERAKHDWPPRISVYPSWPDKYRRLADDMDFPIKTVEEAAKKAQEFVDEIDSSYTR